MAEARYIKVAEAARRLDLTPETIRKRIKAGDLPGVWLGAHLRVDWPTLEAQLIREGPTLWRPPGDFHKERQRPPGRNRNRA
ncbi:MAG TPA: helix-turn-helix domain-containing protein [bacterium]|nr:helix-turn-helix domain-containing protein [bacterium]